MAPCYMDPYHMAHISNYAVTIPLSESNFKRVSALFFGVPYFGCPGQIAALSDECRGFGSDIFSL